MGEKNVLAGLKGITKYQRNFELKHTKPLDGAFRSLSLAIQTPDKFCYSPPGTSLEFVHKGFDSLSEIKRLIGTGGGGGGGHHGNVKKGGFK